MIHKVEERMFVGTYTKFFVARTTEPTESYVETLLNLYKLHPDAKPRLRAIEIQWRRFLGNRDVFITPEGVNVSGVIKPFPIEDPLEYTCEDIRSMLLPEQSLNIKVSQLCDEVLEASLEARIRQAEFKVKLQDALDILNSKIHMVLSIKGDSVGNSLVNTFIPPVLPANLDDAVLEIIKDLAEQVAEQ